jgi:sulfide:quinone oxidoreductase
MTSGRHVPARVLVVGGGVAALETCFALDALAGDRVHVTLIAPNRYLTHRPVGVHDPLAVRGVVRVPLARLAEAAGAESRHDRVVTVDAPTRQVRTQAGYELPYDMLVLAVGAVAQAVPVRAQALRDSRATACRQLMRRLYDGRIRSLAFADPGAPSRSFDLYDLALEAAVTLRRRGTKARLMIVTAEPAPLAILGSRTAGMLRSTLGSHGVRVVESAHVASIGYGEVALAPLSRRVLADAVVAAPRLGGPHLHGVPPDRDGFITTDPHGRVPGVADVFAAGDCTSFPTKHPSLAAQQADAVAAAIAADGGAAVDPRPFKPVLRGILPSRLRWYVDAPLAGGDGDSTVVSALPLWSPKLRFEARFLGSHLAVDHDCGGVVAHATAA